MFQFSSRLRRGFCAALALVLFVSGCSCSSDTPVPQDGGGGGVSFSLGFNEMPPLTVPAGTPFSFTVQTQNATGQLVASNNVLINVAFESPTGVVSGPLNNVTVGGLAVFEFVTNVAQTLTFDITATSAAGIEGAQVDVVAGTPASLVLTTDPPATAIVDQAWAPFGFEVYDAVGNLVTDAMGTVTVIVADGTGAFTNHTVGFSGGVATFDNLSYDTIEMVDIDYESSLGGVTFPPGRTVNVQCGLANVPTHLTFGRAPADPQVAGATWGDGSLASFTVQLRNCFGDIVTSDSTSTVSAEVIAGTGFASGNTTRTASAGVATFNDLIYNVAETVTLDFTSGAATPIEDVDITVNPGALSSLSFTGDPTTGQDLPSTSTLSVTVLAEDTFGNAIPDAPLSLSIGTNPGGGTLRPNPASASTNASGVATFGGVGIDLVGDGYTLVATHMPTGTMGTSPDFNIVPGVATTLSFDSGDGGMQPPTPVTTTDESDDFTVIIAVLDAWGNSVVDGTVVSLALQGGSFAVAPTFETDQASNETTTSSGLATFTGVNITKVGNSTRLRATSGLEHTDSSIFNVLHGVAHHLEFAPAPDDPQIDTVDWDAFGLRVLDAHDNTTTSNSSNFVTISAMSASMPGGMLAGALTRPLSTGTATFENVRFDLDNPAVAETITLTFSTDFAVELEKSAVDDTVIDIEPGPIPAQIALFDSPFGDINPADGDTIIERVDETWSPIVVEVQDSMGGRAFTDSSTTIFVSVVSASTGLLLGTSALSAKKGLAVFDDLHYTASETIEIGIGHIAGDFGMLTDTSDTFFVDVLPRATIGRAIERASVMDDEDEAVCLSNLDQCHVQSDISGDGRFIAFSSLLQLVDPMNPTPGNRHIYVRDVVNGETLLVTGDHGGDSRTPSISNNGRFVAYMTNDMVVSNGVAGLHIAVRDRSTGERILASRSYAIPEGGNGDSKYPVIGGNGRYVAFASYADNLLEEPLEGSPDELGNANVYLRDLVLEKTELVSLDVGGGLARGNSGVNVAALTGAERTDEIGQRPISLSRDGRYVAFQSYANDLIGSDINEALDVFVHDRANGTTERVNLSSAGAPTIKGRLSRNPAISDDGRFVAFESNANNLVAGDTNSDFDVFVRDRTLGTTTMVSVADNGAMSTGASQRPSISADGRYVAFDSTDNSTFAELPGGDSHIFVHDRDVDEDGVYDETGERHTYQADRSAEGLPSAHDGTETRIASISANGAYVVFETTAIDLVLDDSGLSADVYVAPVFHDFTVFATSTQFQPGALFDGLIDGTERFAGTSDADMLCNIIGTNTFGVDTAWVAWMSDETTDAITRLRAGIEQSEEAGRWYRTRSMPSGSIDLTSPVVRYLDQWLSASLDNTIARYETGANALAQRYWTGTIHDGTRELGFTCSSWTSTSGMGRPGRADESNANWTTATTQSCVNFRSLLCMQVD